MSRNESGAHATALNDLGEEQSFSCPLQRTTPPVIRIGVLRLEKNFTFLRISAKKSENRLYVFAAVLTET